MSELHSRMVSIHHGKLNLRVGDSTASCNLLFFTPLKTLNYLDNELKIILIKSASVSELYSRMVAIHHGRLN